MDFQPQEAPNKTTSPQAYVYKPIAHHGEIRVMEIEAPTGALGDSLRCSLRHILLDAPFVNGDEQQQYLTLSYAWGPTYLDGSHLDKQLVCDGQIMFITTNLQSALQRIRDKMWNGPLRLHGRMPPLWVDAVCINQGDLRERSSQVAHMASIFRKSLILVIWLGELSASERHISSAVEHTNAVIGKAATRCSKHLSFQKGKDLPCERSRVLYQDALLEQLLRRSWFERRWVIQEVASTHLRSRYFLAADLIIPFESLGLLARKRPLILHRELNLSNRTLWDNLLAFDSYKCADDRDRIYALLAVSRPHPLIVDYKIGCEDLYINFARLEVDSGLGAGVLACATTRQPSGTQWPSWVPDWRRSPRFENEQHRKCIESLQGCVPAIDNTNIAVQANNQLTVQGWLCHAAISDGRDLNEQWSGCSIDTCFSCLLLSLLEYLEHAIAPARAHSLAESQIRKFEDVLARWFKSFKVPEVYDPVGSLDMDDLQLRDFFDSEGSTAHGDMDDFHLLDPFHSKGSTAETDVNKLKYLKQLVATACDSITEITRESRTVLFMRHWVKTEETDPRYYYDVVLWVLDANWRRFDGKGAPMFRLQSCRKLSGWHSQLSEVLGMLNASLTIIKIV